MKYKRKENQMGLKSEHESRLKGGDSAKGQHEPALKVNVSSFSPFVP
jgi:hypothetical protein